MATKIWVGTSTPGDLNVAGNWSPSGVPTTTDDVHFIDSDQNVTEGFTTFAATTFNSVTIHRSYTGQFEDFVQFGMGSDKIVRVNPPDGGSGQGSQSLLIDTLSTQAIIEVYDSPASAVDTDFMPIRLKVNHASAVVRVMGGLVAIEEQPSDAGQITTLDVLALQGATSPQVLCGSGLTVATVTVHGGEVTLNGTVTTIVVNGGECDVLGAGNVTTATVNGGRCNLSNRPTSGVTVTTLNANDGTTDLTQNPGACTVTTLNQERAATVLLGDHVTITTDNKPGGFYTRSYSTL